MNRLTTAAATVAVVLVSAGYFNDVLDTYRESAAYRTGAAYAVGNEELARILGPRPEVTGFPTGHIGAGSESEVSLTIRGGWRGARVRMRLKDTGRRWEVVEAMYTLRHGETGGLPSRDEESVAQAVRHTRRGYALYENGMFEDATVELSRAVALHPEYELAYFWRGWAYVDLEEYELALADQRRAVELDPTYHQAHQAIAAIHARRGDYEASLPHFGIAIEHDADRTYLYGRGTTLLRLERLDEAVSDFDRACELGHARSCAIAEGTRRRAPAPDTEG